MKQLTLFCLLIFCLIMSGCAFHPRSAARMPSQLKQLYFSPAKPNSVLTTQLTALFQSMPIQLVKKSFDAPYSLIITRDHFSYSRPDIVNTTLPTIISFTQLVDAEIENNKNHVIVATRSFSTSQTLTLNAGQIYTANANNLIRGELNRHIVTLIYYWLVSRNMKDSLVHAAHT